MRLGTFLPIFKALSLPGLYWAGEGEGLFCVWTLFALFLRPSPSLACVGPGRGRAFFAFGHFFACVGPGRGRAFFAFGHFFACFGPGMGKDFLRYRAFGS